MTKPLSRREALSLQNEALLARLREMAAEMEVLLKQSGSIEEAS